MVHGGGFLSKVRPDLWSLHLSMTESEFRAKAAVIIGEWSTNGVCKATQHLDQNGNVQTLGSYPDACGMSRHCASPAP